MFDTHWTSQDMAFVHSWILLTAKQLNRLQADDHLYLQAYLQPCNLAKAGRY